MDGSKWLEISKKEYDQNYTDRINFMHCFNQDSGKIGYYRKEIIVEFGKEWFENNHIKNERMED